MPGSLASSPLFTLVARLLMGYGIASNRNAAQFYRFGKGSRTRRFADQGGLRRGGDDGLRQALRPAVHQDARALPSSGGAPVAGQGFRDRHEQLRYRLLHNGAEEGTN